MKNRNVLVNTLILLLVLASYGSSQTLLKLQHHYFYYDNSIAPRVTISSWHKVSPKFYVSSYFHVNPTWSEGLLGFDYAPNPNFMIGMKAGIQSESNVNEKIDVLRISPFIYYRFKKVSLAAIYEIGGIKDRSIANLDYNFKNSSAGIMLLKKGAFLSIGPRTDLKIPKTPLYIYFSALVTKEGKFASMSGIYARFKSQKCQDPEPPVAE